MFGIAAGSLFLTACSGLSLRNAAIRGDVSRIETRVRAGDNVNEANPNSGTPLHDAIRNRQVAAVHTLIRLGAAVNWISPTKGENATTPFQPLYFAALRAIDSVPATLAIVTALIDAGADPLGTPNRRPLVAAITNNSIEATRLLIAHGALTPDIGPDLLDRAAQIGNGTILDLLLSCGVAPRNSSTDREGTLFAAIRGGNVNIVRTLLAHDASVSDTYNQSTPLALAAELGNREIVALLLEQEAIDHADVNGLFAVHHAARKFNYDIAATLLGHGGEPVPLRAGEIPQIQQYDDLLLLRKQLKDPLPNLLAVANLAFIKGEIAIEAGNAAECTSHFLDSSQSWETAMAHFSAAERRFARAAIIDDIEDVLIGLAIAAVQSAVKAQIDAVQARNSLQLMALARSTTPQQYFAIMNSVPDPSIAAVLAQGAIAGVASRSVDVATWLATRKPLTFSVEYIEGMEKRSDLLKAIFVDRRDVSKRFIAMTQAAARCCQEATSSKLSTCHADLGTVLFAE